MGSPGLAGRILVRLAKLLFSWGVVIRFVLGSAGKEYRIGRMKKLWLAYKVIRNNRKLKPLSTTRQHFLLMEQILAVPKSVPGDVVECGCFNGASTANLSLVCSLTNRRLFVCDSFQGLPNPEEDETITLTSAHTYYRWTEGEFESEGGLEGVKKRIERFGNIESCRFIKGYFEETLKDLPTDSIALVFEDADLPSSVEQCLLHLWPRLQKGCRFYSHEPWSAEVVSLFYNKDFWKERLGLSPPGFTGAAVGGFAGIIHASLGYSEKWDRQQIISQGRRVVHHGSKAFAA